MLFLFLLGLACAEMPVMLIMDYHGGPMQGDAWITLSSPSVEWELQRLVWCKSLVPNDQNPAPLPHNCVGRNLLRIQLYPTPPGHGEAVMREIPPVGNGEKPVQLYRVDPERVGGWDSRHQWIMEMEMQKQGTARSMIQVVRFNALAPLLIGTDAQRPIEETTTAASSSGSTDGFSVTNTPLVVVTPSVEETDEDGVASELIYRPWLGFATILGVGFCLICVVLVVYRLWRRRPFRAEVPTALLHYDWSKNHGLDDMDEDIRLREEDLQILSKVNN